MTEFDEFASVDLENFVDWARSEGAALILEDRDDSDAHANWRLKLGDANFLLRRDYRNWTFTLALCGSSHYPIAYWEHALKGDQSVPAILDIRSETRFLIERWRELLEFPPGVLRQRLTELTTAYRARP